MPRCIGKSATIWPGSRPRSDAATFRCFRHRLLAATGISSFSSARAVVERLVIDHVGHFGDGVANAGGHNVYVPCTLGGGTVQVEASSRIRGRARLHVVSRA